MNAQLELSLKKRKKAKFEWLAFERLKNEYFYPTFLKKDIFNLPAEFTMRTEIE